jgi:DNA-directed RNA polymerase subunit H (RpoH/RPB5)
VSPTKRRSTKKAGGEKGRESAAEPGEGAAAGAPARRAFVAHHLVPPHELLSEEEGREVLGRLGTSIERLPKILMSDSGLKTDPGFVRAREAREPLQGRLVRIRRPSPTAGEAVAYRVLISSVGD